MTQDTTNAGHDSPVQEARIDSQTDTPKVTKQRGMLARIVVPVFKAAAYVIFLAGAVVVVLLGLEKSAEWMLSKSYLGEAYPNDMAMVRRDFTRPVSHYDYDFVPGVCIEYNTFKGNRLEYANNAGFRDPRAIQVPKPADEYRIFLLGGSTAYGMGATGELAPAMGYYGLEYRETISHVMERILSASAPIPGKTIKVYNTAVWGYAYQHHLMRYITKLRRFQPDVVVCLDGANEIPLVSKLDPNWEYFKEGQFHNILEQIYAYNRGGLASYLTLWLKNNTFLMTYLWQGRDIFQELHAFEDQPAFPDQESASGGKEISVEEKSRMVNGNVAQVVKVVEDLHGVLQSDGIPHVFALQPWFYLSRKPLHEQEKAVAEARGYRHYYGIPSDKMYQLIVERIRQSADQQKYLVDDFSTYFDDVSEWVFTDWCHLTAGANYLMAKELANLVKERILGRSLTNGDRISEKDGYFWNLTAHGSFAYAPDAESPDHAPQVILSGYPGDRFYSSKTVAPGEPLELVLDLGETYAMSRTRLVWADDASVPEQWIIEVSSDGKDWQPFVKADRSGIDNFSRWPGFEYYLPEPMEARYVRYRPTDSGSRVIKLRSWSLFR
jgi:hypothetical protein